MTGIATSTALIGAAAISAAATIYSADQQADAAEEQAAAQRESTAAQQKMSSANAARERLKAIREARMRAGAIAGDAGAGGVGQVSSGVAGSIASIGSQAGANIGAINVQEGFAEIASQANQRAADAQADAAQWQAIGNIGQTIFSTAMSRMPVKAPKIG